jgi:hypothetical protein
MMLINCKKFAAEISTEFVPIEGVTLQLACILWENMDVMRDFMKLYTKRVF